MSGPSDTFDPDDLALLLALYDAPTSGDQPRRPPWTWAALTPDEAAALARMIDTWVRSNNHVHAITPTELIPPCWRHHPALAAELAVQLWLWYHVHLDPKATPLMASEYHLRHLPGFRTRVDRLLGISPGECRRGQHPQTWRQDIDTQLADYPTTSSPNDQQVDNLHRALQFGLPAPGGEAL